MSASRGAARPPARAPGVRCSGPLLGTRCLCGCVKAGHGSHTGLSGFGLFWVYWVPFLLLGTTCTYMVWRVPTVFASINEVRLVPITQMRGLRPQEQKQLAQGHTIHQREDQDQLTPNVLTFFFFYYSSMGSFPSLQEEENIKTTCLLNLPLSREGPSLPWPPVPPPSNVFLIRYPYPNLRCVSYRSQSLTISIRSSASFPANLFYS